MSLITKDRVILGTIGTIGISVLGYFGTTGAARIQAQQTAKDEMHKIETELRAEAADISERTARLEVLYPEVNRRLESIEGSLQTINSILLKR